jgi:uncharacterized membrane protein YozB (DUF420 family)
MNAPVSGPTDQLIRGGFFLPFLFHHETIAIFRVHVVVVVVVLQWTTLLNRIEQVGRQPKKWRPTDSLDSFASLDNNWR